MAATNYTPIILYHSVTASAVPTAANLAQGELAININDGKLYYEDSSGVVQVLATKGTGTIGGSNNQVQYNSSGALAGSSNFTFDGTTATINTLNLTTVLDETYGGTGLNSYTAGDLLYATGSNTLGKLSIGTNTYILTSTGSAPQWSAPSAVTVATANNLAGGATGSVPYQSGSGVTTFLSIGTQNQVLTSSGTAPQWSSGLTITTLSTTGNTTLGDAAADNITINGTITSNLIFTDNTYDIGASGATRPRNLYLAGDATIGGSIAATTLDLTNLEVTNIKAKDGTAAMSIADSTGAVAISTALTANGGAVFNESGADLDFRVESDNSTHMLFVDAGNNRVGINTANPYQALTVSGILEAGSASSTAGSVILYGAYAGNSNDYISLWGSQFSSGGPTMAYGLYSDGSTDWKSSYDNFSGSHSVLVLNGNTLRFYSDETDSATTVGSAVTVYDRVSLGRTETVFNEDGRDVDFRVESDGNSTMLVVNGGGNWVSVGNTQWGVAIAPLQANNLAITDTGSAHHILIGNQDSGGSGKPSMIRGVNGTLHLGWGTDWADTTGGTMTQAFSVVGGSPSVVVNDDGEDIDFRVESDTSTHMLFVDAGNNCVNINETSNLGGKLNVNGPIVTDSNHKVHYALPAFYFGAGGITDEYWVVARRYVGSLIAASGLAGQIIGSRGSSGTGNVLGYQNVRLLSAYNVNSLVGLDSLGNEANFVAVDIISISGVEYYALRARPTGGECDNGLFFEGFMVNNTGDANVFTRVRSSDAGVSVVTTNVAATNSWFSGDTYLDAVRAGYSRLLINGTETAINESGENYDFRVESDTNTHALFVDASTSRVGINNASPNSTLDVIGFSTLRKTGSTDSTSASFGTTTEDGAYGLFVLPRSSGGAYNSAVQPGDTVVYAAPQYNPLVLAVHDGVALRLTTTGVSTAGSFTVGGALSKGSGSFRIDHPLPEKTATHQLVHSFIEGPQADLIYRGKATLVAGRAEVNIDEVAGMTEGTFVVLCRDVQCFTSNESDWDAVRGSMSGNILSIECQNQASTATVSWMVIGERQDPHMYATDWTDDAGKVIVEPLKPEPAAQ